MTSRRTELEAAGRRLAEANQGRDAAIAQLGDAVRAARDEFSPTELARIAGVTRVTVYRMLEEEQ